MCSSDLDLHLFTGGLARAVAVGEIGPREPGHGGVPRPVVHLQAQGAAALVQIERAALEDRLRTRLVEVAEVDEVAAQLCQVAAQPDQPHQIRQRIEGEGAQPGSSNPEEFARFVQSEIARWREVVVFSGAKPE